MLQTYVPLSSWI